MPLQDLTDPAAVGRAIAEFDQLGRDQFLAKYGFGKSRSYFLIQDGSTYDSKAIRLRRARQAKGPSQEEGMDRSYVSGLERGEFNVSLVALGKLARAAGVRLTTLVDGD
jgi:5-methylcytosine-specific restriction protein A